MENIYLSGYTQGSLGAPYAGGAYDAFVSKMDASGNLQWTRQLGTSGEDRSWGVSANHVGDVFISGETYGNLGGTLTGNYDAFVAKYDASGNLIWTRQLGAGANTSSQCVASDDMGNVYIAGGTSGNLGGPNAGGNDVFLAKYDSGGNLLWTRQLGTSGTDGAEGIAADGHGNIYVTGSTTGSLGGPSAGDYDAFVAKYDVNGNLIWTRQYGTIFDEVGKGVSVDGSGNVYAAGLAVEFNFSAFIIKYDSAGNLQWDRKLDAPADDGAEAVSATATGNVYVAGFTSGSLDGQNAGDSDAFVARYDASGNLLTTKQFGTSAHDEANAVTSDSEGNAYVSGLTNGSLAELNAGGQDIFVAKHTTVPEPSSLVLLAIGCVACPTVARRFNARPADGSFSVAKPYGYTDRTFTGVSGPI
jgi:hypothetical protein